MIPVMSRMWMPQNPICQDWAIDFNVAVASLPANTKYTTFADFTNNNGGLRLRTGNDGQTSFVSFDDCPAVSDFELEFTARLDVTTGNAYSGYVAWRDTSPGNGAETNFNFYMQWGYTTAPGYVTLFYQGSPSNGWAGATPLFTPTINAATVYTFKLRHVGTSVKVWFDGTLLYDATNSNAGESSLIYFGNKNLSLTTDGYTTFQTARLCILD